jgi:predicted DNA-binding transcriptional regulator YafY
MLLQARGRVTAEQLAEELEVSVRTIYRDIDALSTAGVPVYAERGPGGGCALVEGYRTSLTGLTTEEVKALFMLSVPASLDELGMSQELSAALRKLAAALPDAQRQDEKQVRQRIYLDWADWPQPEPVPHLQTLQQAVWDDRKLSITYRWIAPHVQQFERTVDPYGLVAKAGTWHLVCADASRIRVHRVSGLIDVRLEDAHFKRSADFDLAAFWQAWCKGREESRPSYPVTARISPGLVQLLPLYFGDRIRAQIASAGPPDSEGWITLKLPFDRIETARERILGFGRAIEVLAPEALRLSVIDFARQIVDFYALNASP